MRVAPFISRSLLTTAGAAATCVLLLPKAAPASAAAAELNLTRELMEITNEAMKLSLFVYDLKNDLGTYGEKVSLRSATEDINEAFETKVIDHPDYEYYDYLDVYTQEPDQAVVAKRDGRCYVAFRGTLGNTDDWFQNIDIRDHIIHRNNDTSQEECEVRQGYVDFLDSDAVQVAMADILRCLEPLSCDDPTNDPCLILTGHSQGGASATIASILLYGLNPTVITFGQPPAVDAGCSSIPSERFYRYVNSVKEEDEDDDLAFDPVPFVPTTFSRAVHYGHYIMLGGDPGAVKYLGIDQEYDFRPNYSDKQNEIRAHDLGTDADWEYDARIQALLDNFPIETDGFSDGTFCERSYHELCASGRCRLNNRCGLENETCVADTCEDDPDCASGVCINDACAEGEGMVKGGCPCERDADCSTSGDCDKDLFELDVCEYGPGENTTGGVKFRSAASGLVGTAYLCLMGIVVSFTFNALLI